MKYTIALLFKRKNRPLVIGLSAFVLLLLLSLAYQMYQSYQLEVLRAVEQSENLNLAIEKQVEGVFRSTDNVLLDIIHLIDERGPNYHWTKEKYDALLASRFSYTPELGSLKLFDKNGSYLGSESGAIPADNSVIQSRDYFVFHKTNSSNVRFISRPRIGNSTNQWTLSLSRRISNPDGSFRGVIMAVIPLKYFENTFAKLKLGNQGGVSVFTLKDYTLLVRHPMVANQLGQSIPNSDVFKAIKETEAPVGTIFGLSALDGIERIRTYRVSESLQMVFVIAISKADILKDWKLKSYFLLGMLFVVSLSAMLGLLYFLKQNEEEDRRQIELTRSGKFSALGEMAGGIGHELNNPLALIQMKCALLKEEIAEETIQKEDILKELTKVENTIIRMAKIIRGLKLFARNSENDPMQIAKPTILVEDTLELCREKFRNKGIQLRVMLQSTGDLECRATQVSQVLMNLISNAFDAVESLDERWVEIAVYQKNHSIRFEVTDSGRGIPEAVLEKLMNPFFTTKQVGKGTGLGLSISKGIAEAHQGMFYYDRNSSNTRFVLEIPLRQSPSGKVAA